MLFAIQVVQNMVHDSLTDLTTRLDRSALRICGSNKAGQNRNGLLIAARGWWPAGHHFNPIQPVLAHVHEAYGCARKVADGGLVWRNLQANAPSMNRIAQVCAVLDYARSTPARCARRRIAVIGRPASRWRLICSAHSIAVALAVSTSRS